LKWSTGAAPCGALHFNIVTFCVEDYPSESSTNHYLMKAVQLVKHGNTPDCFRIIEKDKPVPKRGEVLIKVEAFGLNYADVMARLGIYRDAPPLPSVLGYDVVGVVEGVGDGCDPAKVGKRVVAVTEFGGYAEYVATPEPAVAVLPFEMSAPAATALATQYATAWYSAYQLGNIRKGERVFIHAAAGGVGLALIELCRLKECTIYGTVSNETKAEVIRRMGVHHVINSSKGDVLVELKKLENKLDVVFDSVGGKGVKLGLKALRAGGRIICYGGSQLASGSGPIHLIRFGLAFGFYSPIQLLSQSKSILGVNLLKLMRTHPQILQNTLDGILALLQDKKIGVPIGEVFPIDKVFDAHLRLQSRQSIGKIAVTW
jgi:NADPH:quinone reductase-like Zn-dependent oxidoreductase